MRLINESELLTGKITYNLYNEGENVESPWWKSEQLSANINLRCCTVGLYSLRSQHLGTNYQNLDERYILCLSYLKKKKKNN